MPKIGIVTVLYKSESVLQEFFESLEKQTFKDFTLYIIDNKSPDNSLQLAESLSKEVSFKCVFFPEESNWGVAKGNNIGIKAALSDGCEYILLSNNDVVLNHEDTLEILVSKMDNNEKFDILCPKIYYYSLPNIIWAAGGTYVKSDTYTYHYGCEKTDTGLYNVERSIKYTPTCFVIIRSSVFQKIGLMDEWYFVYYDDTDFMYRAYKHGLNLVYTPDTSILHKESISTGKGSPTLIYYMTRNRFYFVRKHRPLHVFVGILASRILAFALKHRWSCDREIWSAELKGLKDGIKKGIKLRKKDK